MTPPPRDDRTSESRPVGAHSRAPSSTAPRDPALPNTSSPSAGKTLSASDPARTSYYGVPVVHKPHWKWLIVVYFFLGGIAGAAYLLALLADFVAPRHGRPIARAGRYLSFAAFIPSPILLVLDLGRPERFFFMLRVLKLRSPMSLGTWALTIFGPFSALAALLQAAEDGALGQRAADRLPAPTAVRAALAVGGPFALFVAGYTGTLLAATAVPLWTKRAFLLGPLFLASALSNAASAIALVLGFLPGDHRKALDRLEHLHALAAIAEMAVLATWLGSLGPTAKPLTEGTTGNLLRHGTVGSGLALPLLLQAVSPVLPPAVRRPFRLLSSTLALAGGFLLRYAVVIGGRDSADDPQATFDLTRERP